MFRCVVIACCVLLRFRDEYYHEDSPFIFRRPKLTQSMILSGIQKKLDCRLFLQKPRKSRLVWQCCERVNQITTNGFLPDSFSSIPNFKIYRRQKYCWFAESIELSRFKVIFSRKLLIFFFWFCLSKSFFALWEVPKHTF